MSIAKLAIKVAVKIPKIEQFERYLFIGPHADDIEIGAGATVAKLASMGKKITFLICTDGRFGDGASDGVKGDALAELRKTECLKSAKLLGVEDVRFLGLKDGGGYAYDDLLKKLAETVSEVNPQIIFAPDHLSGSESHEDHLNVGKAARTIACFAPYENLMTDRFSVKGADVEAIAFYMTSRPNRFVKVKGLLNKQFDSIFKCHTSQYKEGAPESDSLKLYMKIRYYQYGCKEGFRVYSKTHMHCLPEAD